MAITSLGRTGQAQSQADSNGSSYTPVYLAVSDSVLDTEASIGLAFIADSGIQVGSIYPYDSRAVCQSIQVRQDQSVSDGLNWYITCTYSPPKDENQDKAPWEAPAQLNWNYQQFEEVIEFDIQKKAILNSAGDIFSDPITKTNSYCQLTVSQAEHTYDPMLCLQYNNVVNSNTFLGCKKKTVRCLEIPATSAYDQKYGTFYNVQYQFLYSPKGWKKEILDRGYNELNTAGKRKKIKLGDGSFTPIAQRLNSAGRYVGDDDRTTYHWLSFEVYDAIPYRFNFRGL